MVKCFVCDLSLKCVDCQYSQYGAYIYRSGAKKVKRAIESWNHYHPDDLMPQEGFVVHHKNRNKIDDCKRNLEKLTIEEHAHSHAFLPETRVKMRKSRTGIKESAEVKLAKKKRMLRYWADIKSGKRVRKKVLVWGL